jgi:hypothetical protein
MDDVLALRRNNEPPNVGTPFTIDLGRMARNRAGFTIEQRITALEATTTLTVLCVASVVFESTPEIIAAAPNRIVIAFLPSPQQTSYRTLRQLAVIKAKNVDCVDQFLVATERFGIHHLVIMETRLPIQSLAEFCLDNTYLYLKVLDNNDAGRDWQKKLM